MCNYYSHNNTINVNNWYMVNLFFPCVFGVCYYGNNRKISCVFNKNGKLLLNNQRCKININQYKIPIIRGFFYFFCGFYYVFCGIFERNENKSQKSNMVFNVKNGLNVSTESVVSFVIIVVSTLLSVVLLGVVPLKISYLIAPKVFNTFLRRLLSGVIKCTILYIIFLAIKYLPTFSQYYKFNSALINENRNNVFLYLICSVFFCLFSTSLFGMASNVWYFFIMNAFIFLVAVSTSYELFCFAVNHRHVKYIIYPFLFLIYKKPSQIETKCVKIVKNEFDISSNKRDKLNDMGTENNMSFSEAYIDAKQILENANRFEKSDLDFIFCEVLGCNRAQLMLTKTISKNQYNKVIKATQRRASGEPVTKIFNHASFYGLDFYINQNVLSPRMDTERVVEVALEHINKKSKVLDLCTGSGAIAVSVAKNCGCKVIATDVSDDALVVAKQNAEKNGVKINFKKSDLFSNLKRLKFDIIISNPPYIPSGDIEKLDDEVRCFDPIISLDGGITGLDFYDKIIREAPQKLYKNGMIFLEVGINQAKDVKNLLQKNFKDIRIVKDYNKIDRVVYATVNN